MEKVIKILSKNDENSYTLITAFNVSEKSFIVLDSHSKDDNDNEKTYISKIDNTDLIYVDDNDWELVKRVITSIVKEENMEYKYISVSEQYNINDNSNNFRILGLKDDKIFEINSKYKPEDEIQIPIIDEIKNSNPISLSDVEELDIDEFDKEIAVENVESLEDFDDEGSDATNLIIDK